MVISLEYNPVETWMDTMSETGTISFLERESMIEKIKFKLNYDYDEVIGALRTLEFYDSISNIFEAKDYLTIHLNMNPFKNWKKRILVEGDIKHSRRTDKLKYSFEYENFGSGGILRPFSNYKQKVKAKIFIEEHLRPEKNLNMVEFLYDNQDTQATAIFKVFNEDATLNVSVTDQVCFMRLHTSD